MSFWDWLMGTPGAGTQPAKKQTPQRRASVFGLQVGDVVTYNTVDYLVKNKISYDDEGFEWFDYLVMDVATEDEFWLSVEEDDGLQLGIFHEIDLPVGLPPVPRTLIVEGKTFRQYEHSDAMTAVEREDARHPTRSRVEYWEYKGPEEHYLTISRWGGQYEASVGHAIQEYELQVLPGQQ